MFKENIIKERLQESEWVVQLVTLSHPQSTEEFHIPNSWACPCRLRVWLTPTTTTNRKSDSFKCQTMSGECEYQLTYKWFRCQANLFYLWIGCDLTENFDKFLAHLPLLKNLKVLKFEELWGFNDDHFYELMSSMSSLEVSWCLILWT